MGDCPPREKLGLGLAWLGLGTGSEPGLEQMSPSSETRVRVSYD